MTERQALIIAGVVHIVLLAALSLGLQMSTPIVPPADDPIPVELVDISDVPRVTTPPKKSMAAAPQETVEATAPEPEPVPTPPEPTPPAPEPLPAPKPKPKPVEKPLPPKPEKPDAVEAAPPKPEKVKPEKPTKPEPEKAKPAPPKPEKAKPAPKLLDAEALSNLLDKSLPKAKVKPLDTSALAKTIEKAMPKSAMVDARATATLIQAIRAQVAPCWNPPIGGADVKKMTVVLHIEINRDGSIIGRPSVVSQTGVTGGNQDYARAFAETARRAVLRCAPLKLPADLYDTWKAIEINFDPSQMT